MDENRTMRETVNGELMTKNNIEIRPGQNKQKSLPPPLPKSPNYSARINFKPQKNLPIPSRTYMSKILPFQQAVNFYTIYFLFVITSQSGHKTPNGKADIFSLMARLVRYII